MIPWHFCGSDEESTTVPAATLDWFDTAAVPEGWTLSRSTVALGRDADGRWASYAANMPRPYHDPATLAYRGILIEPAEATQLFFRSRSPAGLVGIAANAATVTTDPAEQTPFGLGVTKVIPTATNAQHGFNSTFGTQAALLADNADVVIQIVLKPSGAYARGELFLRSKANVYSTVVFSLTGSGSIIATTGAAMATITPDTDGFFLLVVRMNYGVGTTAPMLNLLIEPDTGARTFAADGTSAFLIAYLGVEAGSQPSAPILTDGTSLVRAADVLTSAPVWMATGSKSLALAYTPLSAAAQVVLQASGTDLIEIRNTPSTVSVTESIAGQSVMQITAASPAIGVERTVVVSLGGTEHRVGQDGTILATSLNLTVATELSTVRIGATVDGGQSGPLLLRRIKYWASTLSAGAVEVFSDDITVPGVSSTLPVVTIQSARTVLESETQIILSVAMDNPLGGVISYRTSEGTAVAGTHFVGETGILAFSPGVSVMEVSIDMVARSTESDLTFSVELFGAIDCTIDNQTCLLTVRRLVQQGPAADMQQIFGPTLPAEWTLTRSTSGRSRNASGIWANNSANTPRQHYIAPGVSGLLIEGAVTTQNIFDSVDPGWTALAATITTDTVTQTPTGTKSIVWRKDNTVTEHRLALTLTQATNVDMPTGDFTVWFLVRPVVETFWRLRVKGLDNIVRDTVVNLFEDGAVVSADAGATVLVEREPILTEWYRVTFAQSQSATAGVAPTIELTPVVSLGGISTEGNITHGLDLCHIQLEPGIGGSSPFVVTAQTAKATRAPDVLKANGTWFQHASYAIGMRFIPLRDAPATQCLYQVRDTANATTSDLQALQLESGSLVLRTRTGSTTLTPTTGGSVTRGVQTTSLMAVDAASRIALFDQGVKRGQVAVGTGGVAAPIAPTVIRLGATEPNGTAGASIVLMAFYFWDVALVDTDAVLFSGNLAYSPPPSDDPPVLSIPSILSVREGETLQVPITKTGGGACSVTFRTRAITNGATLNVDYTGVLTTVSFLDGDTVKNQPVVTLADAAVDPGEKFQIIIESPVDATLGNALGEVTITELPIVSMPSSFSVNEGSAAVITLSKVGTGACSVTVQTGQVSAAVGVDYTGIGPLAVSFGADETSKTVTIQTTADAAAEQTETFNLNILSATDCTTPVTQCVVSIIDASAEPEPPAGLFAAPRGFSTGAEFGIARSGGSYYRVTSLADGTAAGTLGGALGLSNRLVIFEVGGVIKWGDDRRITGSNLTFAGETAPYPGITIQGGPYDPNNPGDTGGKLMSTLTSRQIKWSHIVFERGYADPNVSNNKRNSNGDSFTLAPNRGTQQQDWWFDHCGFFWSNDENVELYQGGGTGTHENSGLLRWDFTNCMFCEPLWAPETMGKGYMGHYEGGEKEFNHNYNFLVGPYCKQGSMQYNLFTEHNMRGPFIDHSASIVVANNVYLNCSMGASIEMNSAPTIWIGHKVTCVGQLMISGPNALTPHPGFRFVTYPNPLPGTGGRYYVQNLYAMRGSASGAGLAPTAVTWDLKGGNQVAQPGVLLASTAAKPIDIPGGVSAMAAQDIYDRAVANVGPRPKENSGKRAHPAVARAIQKLKDKTGKWVNHESVEGGGTGRTVFSTTTRALNGLTTFPDGATIPAPPTYSNAAEVKAWLKLFTERLQYD